jgi:hypothetical protein
MLINYENSAKDQVHGNIFILMSYFIQHQLFDEQQINLLVEYFSFVEGDCPETKLVIGIFVSTVLLTGYHLHQQFGDEQKQLIDYFVEAFDEKMGDVEAQLMKKAFDNFQISKEERNEILQKFGEVEVESSSSQYLFYDFPFPCLSQ